jgi:hexosaminidase
MFKRLDVVNIQLENYGLTHIKNYEMLMRRITKNYNVEVLKNFIDVVNPLYTYSRDRPHVFKSYYPLTRVVDISIPDPKIPREFDLLVEKFTKSETPNNNLSLEIKNWLNLWKSNHEQLISVIKSNQILKEVMPVANELKDCSMVGLEAIEMIMNNKKADDIWLTKTKSLLDQAKLPKAEIELSIVKSIQKLVNKVQ